MSHRLRSKVFSVLLGLAFLLMTTGCNPRSLPVVGDQLRWLDQKTTEETDRAIAKDPQLQEIEKVCNSIPKDQSFSLYAKRMAHTYPLTLFYFYSSPKNYDTAEREFGEYFQKGEWERREIGSVNRVVEYKNETYRVTIQFGGMGPNANYGFSCERGVTE